METFVLVDDQDFTSPPKSRNRGDRFCKSAAKGKRLTPRRLSCGLIIRFTSVRVATSSYGYPFSLLGSSAESENQLANDSEVTKHRVSNENADDESHHRLHGPSRRSNRA